MFTIRYLILFSITTMSSILCGCSSKPSIVDMGGEDGSKIAAVIEDLNEAKHNAKKLPEFFVDKGSVPSSKDMNKYQFYVIDKPSVNGLTGSTKVLVEKMDGTKVGESEWTFEKQGEKWKIKSAPIP